MGRRKKKESNIKRWISSVILVIASFGLIQAGLVGEIINNIMLYLFGDITYLLYIFLIVISITTILNKQFIFYKQKKIWGLLLIVFSIFLLINNYYFNILENNVSFDKFNQSLPIKNIIDGGILGYILYTPLFTLFGNFGIWLISISTFIIGLTFIINLNWNKLISISNKKSKKPKKNKKRKKENKNEFDNKDKTAEELYGVYIEKDTADINSNMFSIETMNEEIKNNNFDNIDLQVDYKLPNINLLNKLENNSEKMNDLKKLAEDNAHILEKTLKSFNLKANISNIKIGPNITKYELEPEMGTKVSKFSSLSNDLALALAAETVRIEAPIPGKAAVGIEIPNQKLMMVGLKEVLESPFNKVNHKLQVGLGKDITGKSIFLDLDKAPHLLVAGATGSGKSVCINSIIVSILLKASPDEVKMIMIDPKKVELTPYNGIPHLLTPVVTEPKKAAIVLNKMVLEMEERYEMFAQTNTRNIESFNKKIKDNNYLHFKKLPYIVVIIDELADLMMVASSQVETTIARLAQMARAAGIHLIVATQRPSTDVITGLIKANIPTRIAFGVSSGIDSRTILDVQGAEKLLGKGDMLLSENGKNILNRIQGTYLSDEEITKITNFIIDNNSDTSERDKKEFSDSLENINKISEQDAYYWDAIDLLENEKGASTSMLQRKLKIGFNRANTIMDQLEDGGVVGPACGTKARQIIHIPERKKNEEKQ